MIDFTEIPSEGEVWELFARDFLQELGFFIESSPDRGSDGGKDLIITEELAGTLGNYKFRWLVSCKHFATSNKSVGLSDEINIQERLDSFNADGFLGFYSTIVSSGLNTRLRSLRENQKIKDYKIFDNKVIENYLFQKGFSNLMMRYFPDAYKINRPLHRIYDKYIDIKCQYCSKDILESLYTESYSANLVFVIRSEITETRYIKNVENIYCCCKGSCDNILSNRYERREHYTTQWRDISDLVMPIIFIDWVLINMRTLRNGEFIYTDKSFEDLKNIIIGIAQKVLRESTGQEKERMKDLSRIDFYSL